MGLDDTEFVGSYFGEFVLLSVETRPGEREMYLGIA